MLIPLLGAGWRPLVARVALAALALLVLGATGCDDSAGAGTGADSGACTTSVECALPLSCIEGRCRLECRADRDCTNGAICADGECRSYPATCRFDSECAPFGEVCDRVRNRCVPPGVARCDDDLAPCAAGQLCLEGRCVLPGADLGPDLDRGVGPDRGPDPDTGADRGVTPDRGPGSDRGPDPDTGADRGVTPDEGPACPPQGEGNYGDRCQRGGDCASGFCVENKLRGMRVCTSLCDLRAPDPAATCPGIDVCVQAQAGEPENPECPPPVGAPAPGEIVGVCFANETGLPCDFEGGRPGECIGGACIQPINPAAGPFPWMTTATVCGAGCVDDRRCPAGTTCRAVGAAGRLCAPSLEWLVRCDGAIDFCGGACPTLRPEQEAEAALCLTVNGREGGYCSCQCASNRDCHPGYACGPIGGGVKACIPFSGLRCPAEGANPAPCARDNQCQAAEICLNGRCQQVQCPSLTCLIDDVDPRLNACTAQCANDADCPAGFACTQFPGAGGFCVARP